MQWALLSASIASQSASVPSFGRRHRGRSQQLPEKPETGLFSCAHLVSTWLGPQDASSCASWVSQQLVPLLPKCSADSGDLLNQMLFAYWSALCAFCLADTKCISFPKSYLEPLKMNNYRDSRCFVPSLTKSISSDPIRFLFLVISTKLLFTHYFFLLFSGAAIVIFFLAAYLLMSKVVLIS